VPWPAWIVLATVALFGSAVLVRLVGRRGAGRALDAASPRDRRLVGAALFYLVAPALWLATQLTQVAVLWSYGVGVARFESWAYWGVVEAAEGAPRAAVLSSAVLGPVVLLCTAGLAFATVALRPGAALANHALLELGRVTLTLGLFVHPALGLLMGRGDLVTLRALLVGVEEAQDVSPLLFGLGAGLVFWAWQRAAWLRGRGSPIWDVQRRAEARLALDPGDPQGLRDRGAAELAFGRVDGALSFLERAAEASPSDPRVPFLLGRAHLERGAPEAAAARLREAGQLLEERGGDRGLLFEVTLALSTARLALRDAEGAILTAEAARAQAPANPRGLLVWVDALVAGGRGGQARGALEEALPSASGPLAREIRRRLSALDPALDPGR
jgi:tetratricopeptide (TPR) repeat protein